ncbi:hypothetical protein [Pontibacter liquoris]|uniref:hypothetical protein n=1 Tax=Pontibacter liquoris TaxID=2905677 RepID=UPI001FA6B452|nr:hypothetical protein [Pontibacter liquoris]
MKCKSLSILFLVLAVSTLTSYTCRAQIFLEEVNGRPIRVGQYENVVGSPYLQDEWRKGTVKLANGETYPDVDLKYDQVQDIPLFRNKAGETLEIVQSVAGFTITYLKDGALQEAVFRNGYPGIKGASRTSFYEVLAEGKVDLLKRTNKVIREEKAYNSATITKNILPVVTYYIAREEQLVNIKNDRKSILEALADKAPELDAYIKKNKLRLKEDADLAQLINYYNSLQ